MQKRYTKEQKELFIQDKKSEYTQNIRRYLKGEIEENHFKQLLHGIFKDNKVDIRYLNQKALFEVIEQLFESYILTNRINNIEKLIAVFNSIGVDGILEYGALEFAKVVITMHKVVTELGKKEEVKNIWEQNFSNVLMPEESNNWQKEIKIFLSGEEDFKSETELG